MGGAATYYTYTGHTFFFFSMKHDIFRINSQNYKYTHDEEAEEFQVCHTRGDLYGKECRPVIGFTRIAGDWFMSKASQLSNTMLYNDATSNTLICQHSIGCYEVNTPSSSLRHQSDLDKQVLDDIINTLNHKMTTNWHLSIWINFKAFALKRKKKKKKLILLTWTDWLNI